MNSHPGSFALEPESGEEGNPRGVWNSAKRGKKLSFSDFYVSRGKKFSPDMFYVSRGKRNGRLRFADESFDRLPVGRALPENDNRWTLNALLRLPAEMLERPEKQMRGRESTKNNITSTHQKQVF